MRRKNMHLIENFMQKYHAEISILVISLLEK